MLKRTYDEYGNIVVAKNKQYEENYCFNIPVSLKLVFYMTLSFVVINVAVGLLTH